MTGKKNVQKNMLFRACRGISSVLMMLNKNIIRLQKVCLCLFDVMKKIKKYFKKFKKDLQNCQFSDNIVRCYVVFINYMICKLYFFDYTQGGADKWQSVISAVKTYLSALRSLTHTGVQTELGSPTSSALRQLLTVLRSVFTPAPVACVQTR